MYYGMSLPSSSFCIHFIFSFALMFSLMSCLVYLIKAVHTSRLIMYYKLYITTVYIICVYVRGVQHIMCCVVVLFFSIFGTLCCHVTLDFPFFIAPSVFSNVYFRPVSCVPDLASYSGFSIFDCPFGFL